jgi:hypothetical protein
MLSELHSFNSKLCSKQNNKIDVLRLIVVSQLSSGWQHNYSTKTRLADCTNEQSNVFSYVYKVSTVTVTSIFGTNFISANNPYFLWFCGSFTDEYDFALV